MLSCRKELMAHYVALNEGKFDPVEYFCVHADGGEDEEFITEFMAAGGGGEM